MLVLVKEEVTHVLIEICAQHPAIKVITDSPSIHRVTNEILETSPWDLLVPILHRLGEVETQEATTDVEVTLIEVIGNIPPNLPKLPPLQDNGMEVAEGVDERAEGPVRTLLQHIIGQTAEGGAHVELQTIRRLRHDLETSL